VWKNSKNKLKKENSWNANFNRNLLKKKGTMMTYQQKVESAEGLNI